MSDVYLIDSNVMIEAANLYYRFDRVPRFWEWMTEAIAAGSIRTASLVADEIKHPAELVAWIDDQEENGFYVDVSDGNIQAKYSEVAAWLISQSYGPEHVASFLSGADAWIIATAAVTGAVVVTQEKPVGAGSRKVRIPDVCGQFNVECIETFGMLDRLNPQF